MKFYYIDTTFAFGKFNGKTIKEVIEIEPSYIDWCAINLDHFYITNAAIEDIKKITPNFSISEEAKSKLSEKYEAWANKQEDRDNYYNRYDYIEKQTYNEYEGSYAQDVAHLSDQFIGDVLDGEPEAYWNID